MAEISADSGLGQALGANSNKSQAQEIMKQAREKAKKEHAVKVIREKELLLKDKLKKEVSRDVLVSCNK